jgi:hypothetical protein
LFNSAPPLIGGRFMTTKPALQMLDQALGDDLRHDFVGVVDALAAAET